MALSASGIVQIDGAATAGNVNAGYFNPTNANMLTNGTVDTNTGNTSSPVFSSASYNFAAGDVNHWLYIQAGTNCFPGWYKISSVAGGKATLSAAIGAAEIMTSRVVTPSTVVGIASVGTPTGITFTIDYSRSTAAFLSLTDLASVGSSTTLTSATAAFTPVMVGNGLHQTTTGTGGFGLTQWFEIVSYTNSSTVVTDRTTNNGTAEVAVTGQIGGALSLGSSDDAIFELGVSSGSAATIFFVKGNQTYTINGTVSVSASGNNAARLRIEGYNSFRGDRPLIESGTQPIFALGANAWTLGTSWTVWCLTATTTSAAGFALGAQNQTFVCKFLNTSTTANRVALTGGDDSYILYCEIQSYRGTAYSTGQFPGEVFGCYLHDSNNLYTGTSSGTAFISFSILMGAITSACNFTAGNIRGVLSNNTFYGAENKLGTMLNLAQAQSLILINNIIAGFSTAVSNTTTNIANVDMYNDYYNNTTDINNTARWQKGAGDIAVNPSFTNVTQITGTTGAFTAGNNILVDTTKNFTSLGVVPGRDFLYISAGTGVTNSSMWVGITSISTTTNPNDTLNLDIAQGTNTTTDKVYQITVGRNFLPTGSI